MMPFEALISAWITFTPLIKTPFALLVTNTESPLAAITFALGPAGTLAAGIAEGITWYSNRLERSVVEIELRTSDVMPALVNPSLVGANRVKGPVPLSVVVRFAFTSA